MISARAQNLYKNVKDPINKYAHKQGMDYMALLKGCAKEKDLNKVINIHDNLKEKGLLEKNPYLASALITIYATCGALEKAYKVFMELQIRDVVSWCAIIGGYTKKGKGREALDFFERMQNDGIAPDLITFACALKACGSVIDIDMGRKIHKTIIDNEMLGKNIVLDTALVDMYAKCGELGKAENVLEELPVRDVVSWNALISGYVQYQRGKDALKCLEVMQCEGIFPDTVTFTCILKACGALGEIRKGKQIHDEIICKSLLEENVMLGNALVDMYAKCDDLKKAQRVFDELPIQDLVSWNALISGYAQHGHNEGALKCFKQMRTDGFCPNAITFTCILKTCGIDMGKQIHHEIIHMKCLNKHVELGNALVDMYAKCCELEKAEEVFDELCVRDIVSWNVLIAGYVQRGEGSKAITCFKRMQCDHFLPNTITFICILKACSSTGALHTGEQIHSEIVSERLIGKVLELDTALVDMYAKCGQLEKAQKVLKGLPVRDVASWNALISGYSQHRFGQEALNLFEQMQNDGLSPDAITFVSLLKACGSVGAVDKGIEIHNEIMSKRLLEGNIELGNALVDMYAKCGELEKAQKAFNDLSVRDVISWNALISGYAEKGHAEKALDSLKKMQLEGQILPDAVTFLCVLNACSHSGYVNEGKYHFEDMKKRYGITPNIQHYTCMVDLFCRIGHFDEAMALTKEMPTSDSPRWCALLGACQKWDNVKLGRLAFEKAVQLNDTHGVAYMHMVNMYAATCMQKGWRKNEVDITRVKHIIIADNCGHNV